MSELTLPQIRVEVVGAVQSSNLSDFAATVREQLGKIKTELVTDDDFAEAESVVKACKSAESKISEAKEDAISQTKDIADLLATMDSIKADVAAVRLNLEKKVKTEKDARRSKIVNDGISYIESAVMASAIGEGFAYNRNAFADAVKGKKTLESMKSAVSDVSEKIAIDLKAADDIYKQNIAAITLSEDEYTGLFPDKKHLSLKHPDTVSAIIESRIASFKLAQEKKANDPQQQPIQQQPKQDNFIPPPPPTSGKITVVATFECFEEESQGLINMLRGHRLFRSAIIVE